MCSTSSNSTAPAPAACRRNRSAIAAIFNIAAVLLIALQVHAIRNVERQRETIAYVQPAPPPEPVKPAIKIPPPPPLPKPKLKV